MADDGKITLHWHYLGEIEKFKDEIPFPFESDGKKIKPFPGIYVWIWGGKTGDKYVHYIGQSKDIWKRLETEVSGFIGGAWVAYNLEPGSNLYEVKKKIFLKEPSYCEVIEANCYCGVSGAHYSPNRGKKDSISAMVNDDRIRWASNMLKDMYIAVAKIEDDDQENQEKKRLYVEAALIHGLRKHLKLSDKIPRYILDVFFGRVTKEPTEAFNICHDGDFKQLPEELTKIKQWEKLK
ncbi:MAG: hypothetical protein WC347_11070 [Smithellaceae bacterium]|jgi:hypothetical protein